MKPKLYTLSLVLTILSLVVSACGTVAQLAGPRVTVSIVYGSEKRDWLEPLIAQFNTEQHKTDAGATITVESTAMGSIESVTAIIDGAIQPAVWSPASSVYIPVANAEWRKQNASDLVTGTPNDLVLSPVVIAMWKPMADALGYPKTPLGWADIARLATSDKGWADYGFPEWGKFKFGHTHPGFSNSGVVAVLAQIYAATGKQRDLTPADVADPKTAAFVADVQKSIIHYGTSTGFFADRMFQGGPSYLSAAVLYENLIVAQETKRLAGQVSQVPVVAVYPKEGTFWSNHPYITLNAPWVTAEQKSAAEVFEKYLLDKPQQLKALEFGFRPADAAIPLTAPLDAQHGVDPSQPQTILEIPSAEVIQSALGLWKQAKKPVDVVVVMDISGSMAGDKIATARTSLVQFINQLDDRDRLEVRTFNDELMMLSPLAPVGEKRAELTQRVSGIFESGGTALYDAVSAAYADLAANGDPNHIRAVVVLTDGQDTASAQTLNTLLGQISRTAEEGGNAIKLFTIAFGGDADNDVLKQIAEATGGKQYAGDPQSILLVYADIATFF